MQSDTRECGHSSAGAAATVALFANALGVVGFHGAGLANALFIWRSNRRVADETGAPLRWQVMNISSSAIAEHNGKEASRMMSKFVPFIPLRAHEIAQAARPAHCYATACARCRVASHRSRAWAGWPASTVDEP